MSEATDDSIHNLAISSSPERGWVTVVGEVSNSLEHPIVELSVLSADGQALASTIIMDTPSSFRVTLHPHGAERGMPLVLQVKLISAEDTSVETVGEYSFQFEPS